MPFYGVDRGRQPGVYADWDDCKPNVSGFSNARFRKFDTLLQAEEFTNSNVRRIYVDGASRRNGQDAIPMLGYCVYHGQTSTQNVAVPLSDVDNVWRTRPTNQRAELHAMVHALRDIWNEERSHYVGGRKYEILTDSLYAKRAIEKWSFKWSKNGWKNCRGDEVSNRDLIEKAFDFYELINSKLTVVLTHVNGHLGNVGNELADRFANMGANRMVR